MYGVGDSWGQPVQLELFEKLFILWLFELLPNGQRRYRRALLVVPKGCGKTSLAAWIGLYLLATQPSAVIPVVAASYDQANLVFGDMRTCVSESPTLRRVMTGFEGEIQVDNSPSRAFKVPAVAGVNDGMRPSTAVFDEVHEFVTPNQTRTHLVVGNGCAKRSGSLQLSLQINTSVSPPSGSAIAVGVKSAVPQKNTAAAVAILLMFIIPLICFNFSGPRLPVSVVGIERLLHQYHRDHRDHLDLRLLLC